MWVKKLVFTIKRMLKSQISTKFSDFMKLYVTATDFRGEATLLEDLSNREITTEVASYKLIIAVSHNVKNLQKKKKKKIRAVAIRT